MIRTREDQLRREAAQFIDDNPEFWRLFKKFALQAINTGRRKYSARAIFHRIRWHTRIEIKSNDEYKVNDHCSPYIVEMFEEDHPEHVGFFTKRARTSSRSKPR
jgi:hypothetical protein